METDDIKQFLEKETNIPVKQWKRLSKSKNIDDDNVRVFEDKLSGIIVHTLEKKDGSISIIDPSNSISSNNLNNSTNSQFFTPTQLKSAKKLIVDFLENGKEPDEKKSGFVAIPSFFNFSFLEDANCDWTTELEDIVNTNNPKNSVDGVNIFFMLKDKSLSDSSCFHLQSLLYQFLPNFMDEVEESTFHIKNGNPVAYDQFIATLEKVGFTYDEKSCMLANLGGSNGASAIVAPDSSDIKPEFAIISVKKVSCQEPEPKNLQLISALVFEHPDLKTRAAKERFINSALKKYQAYPPGRLSNGHIPQLDVFQMIKKSSILINTEEQDRVNIFDILIAQGWIFNPDLATIDKAKQWKCEDWTIEPFEGDTPEQAYLSTRSDISYLIWTPNKFTLKP